VRLAIAVLVVLATSACVAKHPVQTASRPAARPSVDSANISSKDSVFFRDMRRLVAQTDSLIKELRAIERKRPN
jgi:hypothetical protein